MTSPKSREGYCAHGADGHLILSTFAPTERASFNYLVEFTEAHPLAVDYPRAGLRAEKLRWLRKAGYRVVATSIVPRGPGVET